MAINPISYIIAGKALPKKKGRARWRFDWKKAGIPDPAKVARGMDKMTKKQRKKRFGKSY